MSRRAIVGLLAGVLVLAAVFYAGRVTGTPAAEEQAPASTAVPKPTVIAGAGILRRVQALSRLETALYNIETVVRTTQEGQQVLFWSVGDKRILQVVHGTVIAGLDLEKMQSSDIVVSPDNKSVTVQLPPAEIFIATLDSSELVDYEGLPLTQPSPQMLEQAQQQGRLKIQEIACRDNILEMATKQGQAAVTNLLSSIPLDGATIIVQPALVPSCTVEVTVKPAQ